VASLPMAESAPDPGAPFPKDEIDPDLVKLARTRPKIGAVTCAGIVVLAVLFVLKLNPDRRFGGQGDKPDKLTAQAIVAGQVAIDSYVTVTGEPEIAGTLRAAQSPNETGLRVVPLRGTSDHLWVVMSGDGWVSPSHFEYAGRLRKLSDLPFASALEAGAEHPRPVFAPPSEIRAAFASNTLAGLAIADADRVAIEVVDPTSAAVVAGLVEKAPTAAAWTQLLADAGLPVTKPGTPVGSDRIRFDIAQPIAEVTAKLAAAHLLATRVEAVTRSGTTTWGKLKSSPPGALAVDGATIPDGQIDLVGVYAVRGVPSDAYAIITDERPADYWYVLPITIVLAAIGLVFLYGLVLAIRRDFLDPARARGV